MIGNEDITKRSASDTFKQTLIKRVVQTICFINLGRKEMELVGVTIEEN